MKYSAKRAFSLIELSIVILIIGILIAGITQSGRMVKKFKIATAQSLTKNSPVAGISDLLFWYETSMDASFNTIEAQNKTAITNWYDLNSQSDSKINATQSTAANKPLYIDDAFNSGIPGIRFDGINDLMTFDGSALIGSNYTIFVVEQRRSNKSSNYFIGGTSTATNTDLILGWGSNTSMMMSQWGNDMSYTNAALAYTSPIARIHTFRLSTITGHGKAYWLNGGTAPEQSDTTAPALVALISFPGPALGRYDSNFYSGDLAEIIVYTRPLNTDERQAIENYLSKKYNILIS